MEGSLKVGDTNINDAKIESTNEINEGIAMKPNIYTTNDSKKLTN